MKIFAVDQHNDLFVVEDLLPDYLLNQINDLDLWNHPWQVQDMQTDWNRRKLLLDKNSPLDKVDIYYNNCLSQIEKTLKIEFEHKHCWSAFWLDYEGFFCAVHEDGAERGYTPNMAMQVYLTESPDNLGTVWYYDMDGENQRYSFPYKKNTGYLMINRAGQWHGMTNKVPHNHLRLSTYTYFGKFINK